MLGGEAKQHVAPVSHISTRRGQAGCAGNLIDEVGLLL